MRASERPRNRWRLTLASDVAVDHRTGRERWTAAQAPAASRFEAAGLSTGGRRLLAGRLGKSGRINRAGRPGALARGAAGSRVDGLGPLAGGGPIGRKAGLSCRPLPSEAVKRWPEGLAGAAGANHRPGGGSRPGAGRQPRASPTSPSACRLRPQAPVHRLRGVAYRRAVGMRATGPGVLGAAAADCRALPRWRR